MKGIPNTGRQRLGALLDHETQETVMAMVPQFSETEIGAPVPAPAEVPEEPLETETTEDGDVVLKADQNPQTSPDTDVVCISSMGFDEEGNFHIRLAFAEGITGMLLARPCGGDLSLTPI